jgi:hypothetical protein
MLELFSSPQPIVRRRLADRDRIGARKSFLKGFVELPIELALPLGEGRSGRGLRGFLVVFSWADSLVWATRCPPLSSAALRSRPSATGGVSRCLILRTIRPGSPQLCGIML